MKVLFLAFIDTSYSQILNKVNSQLKYLKKYLPGSACVVIGTNYKKLNLKNYDFEFIDISSIAKSSIAQVRYEVAQKVVDTVLPDIIYFRFPMYNKLCFDFVKKNEGKVIFEIQSKTINEISQIDAEEENKFAPLIYQHTLGIVAVTDEIAKYELKRSDYKQKIHVMSNGIDINSLSFSNYIKSENIYNILCLANFSKWHGYERLLMGLSQHSQKDKFKLYFIGDGNELSKYEQLTANLKLTNHCEFLGKLNSEQISRISEKCIIAVSSLGLQRIGLKEFCNLKNREYCLRGIPFIYAGKDVDLTGKEIFAQVFPSDESPINFEVVQSFCEKVSEDLNIKILERDFAINNLSWETRIKDLVSFFESVSKNQNLSELTNSCKFSIIMANYNGAKYIEQAINSVLNQTFIEWELIIVDDSSTDNSVEIIKKYLKDRRINLIEHSTNKKYTSALITGIENVNSDYFGILDSDDVLTTNAIEVMYNAHQNYPNGGYIYSQFLYCDENLKPQRPGYCASIPRGKTNLELDTVSHFKTFKNLFIVKPKVTMLIFFMLKTKIFHIKWKK